MSVSSTEFISKLTPSESNLFNAYVKVYMDNYHYTEEEAIRKAIEGIENARNIHMEMKAIGFNY
jgi:hypothetical protein